MNVMEGLESVCHVYRYDFGTSLSIIRSESGIILTVSERDGPGATAGFSKEKHPMTFEFLDLLGRIIAQTNKEKEWTMDRVVRYFDRIAEEQEPLDQCDGDPEWDGPYHWQDPWEESPICRRSDIEGNALTLRDFCDLYQMEVSETVDGRELVAHINFSVAMDPLVYTCIAKLAQSIYEDNLTKTRE